MKIYKECVTSVLKNFPQVKLFDVATSLCDNEYCYGMKEKKFFIATLVILAKAVQI